MTLLAKHSPCGHLFCCALECDSARLSSCPLCRTPVRERTRLFGVIDALRQSGLGLSSSDRPASQAPRAETKQSSHGAHAVLTKVRGAFSQLEQRLKTREESTTRLSEFHESELKYTCLLPELEASADHLEDCLGRLQRQLDI